MPPAPASPEAEEAALEVPEEEEDARCPLESETRALSIADPLGATTYRYVIVTRCQTFRRAQVGRGWAGGVWGQGAPRAAPAPP